MASHLSRVQGFAEAALAARSISELGSLMEEATRHFGADYYLMIHHADFRQKPKGLVKVGNYPQDFIAVSRAGAALTGDAVMEACERSLTGFFWSDVGTIVPLTERHKERAEVVANTGLGDGFVVPAHIPGEHLGSCHFAVGRGKIVPRENSAALQSIATFGFEAARRLARIDEVRVLLFAPLTKRQRECLVLAARGKSDPVIAQLLGLSPKTVNKYMEAAKSRFGVATRSQLIANALYASEITFRDVVDVLQ